MATEALAQELPFDKKPRDTVVYWLYDDTCSKPENDGYVGITCRLKARVLVHIKDKRFPIGFRVSILFEGTRHECLNAERRYRPHPGVGWNSASGGGAGRRFSKSTRARMSASAMGHRRNLGVPRTIETRAKLSLANANRSPEWKEKMIKSLTGYRHTQEAKANMGKSKLGHPVSIETRAKIGAANRIALKGFKHSTKTKQKMSESAKKSWDTTRRSAMSIAMTKRWAAIKANNEHYR